MKKVIQINSKQVEYLVNKSPNTVYYLNGTRFNEFSSVDIKLSQRDSNKYYLNLNVYSNLPTEFHNLK